MIVVKVPGINSLGKNNGCRNAGNAIIAGLDNIYSNENNKVIDRKLIDLEEIHVDNQNLEEQEKLIYKNSFDLLKQRDKVIFLGGDHSISYSTGRAFLDYCKEKNKKPVLIVFDAHADCMEAGKEPTHEEWLRGLIEKGFPEENVLLVGVRNLWKKETEFLSKNKIKRIDMDSINNNLEEITDIITEFGLGKDKEAYVSFDIDVVDPAFAPSTGYGEAGGLSSRQAVYIIKRLSKIKNMKAFDIVEVDSEGDKEKNNVTVKLASKILAELL